MSYNPFASLPVPTPDPIFAVTAEAIAAGPSAINGTIGVVMDEEGNVVTLPSVRKAIKDVAAQLQATTFSYPKLWGVPAFRESVTRMVFEPGTITAEMATTGGTGAVTINLRLIKLMQPDAPIILPMPAWGNHPPVCRAAGIRMIDVPYLRDARPRIDELLDVIKRQTGPFSLLLQVGCHNPTGLDFTAEQWKEIVAALEGKQAIALLDFAYQGFIGEPEDDAKPIHLFIHAGIPSLISWSASKNHTIYGLRTGLACAVVKDAAMKATVEGHYSTLTRGIHSAASVFGQMIVARVQEAYRDEWLKDLREARGIIKSKRNAMIQALPPSFKNALDGEGMFAMLPLTAAQVGRLKKEQSVFMTDDGRINISGIPDARIGELGEKIARVL